jgi:hypothetical protein
MNRDEFWTIIERAREEAGDDPEGHDTAERVLEELREAPLEQILGFDEQLARLQEASYSWGLWGAAYLINGGCSDDGFEYFRGWLITRGRAAFEAALAEPDSLAGLQPDEDRECEELLYGPAQIFNARTGNWPEGDQLMRRLPDLGPGWDFDDGAEMEARYPRLWKRFGW